jgi:hypothetical protein
MQGLKAGTHYQFNAQSNIITFQNGSTILLKDLFQYPSDPNFDELGSLEITDAFVDENSQITEKAWNTLKSRIRYGLDENGLIPKILGSCNPSKNFIYHRFYKPHKNGTLPPERKFIQALVTDNPDISKHYRDNLLSLDKASKERLLYGNWEYDDDPATLIDYDKIIDCFTNNFIDNGDRYISADIARFGSDKTVINIWDGFRCKIFMFAKKSVQEIQEELAEKFGPDKARLGLFVHDSMTCYCIPSIKEEVERIMVTHMLKVMYEVAKFDVLPVYIEGGEEGTPDKKVGYHGKEITGL